MNSMIFPVILLFVSIGTIRSIPLTVPSDVETHTFRWITKYDLNNTKCAYASKPARLPNDTLHPDPNWSFLHGCLILMSVASTPEDDRMRCQNKNSLFTLIGNPGMLWHQLSGQCVHTKMVNYTAGGSYFDGSIRLIPHKTLMTSCECERNISSVALFKYDENKPQRLVFLEIDPKTNKTQEWCIYQADGYIQMLPKCDEPPIELSYGREVVFDEFNV